MVWFPWKHPNLAADIRQPNSRPVSHALFYKTPKPLRPMRVMVDASLQQHQARDQKVDYLLQLLAVPPIEGLLFAYGGPPETARKARDGVTGIESFVDWIAVDIPDTEGSPVLLHWKNGRPVETPLRRAPPELSQDERDGSQAVLIADATDCDIFITGVDVLAKVPVSDWSRLTVMPAYDALPLVGLYLRRQGGLCNTDLLHLAEARHKSTMSWMTNRNSSGRPHKSLFLLRPPGRPAIVPN